MNESNPPIVSSRPAAWEVACLLAGAAVVRIAVLLLLGGNLAQDPDAYGALAESLATERAFAIDRPNPDPTDRSDSPHPTAYRPPVYPIILSPIYAVSGDAQVRMGLIGMLHVVFGVACTYLTYLFGRQLGFGRGSLITGALVAIDPLLLQQSTLIMTETLAACLTAGLLVAIHRWRIDRKIWLGIAIRLLFGLAILCRPVFLAWAGLIGIVLVIAAVRRPVRLIDVAVLGVPILVVLSVWMVRNERVFYPVDGIPTEGHRPVFATTHGGYTLLLGNNRAFYDHLRTAPIGKIWNAEDPDFEEILRDAERKAESSRDEDYRGLDIRRPSAETYLDRVYYDLAFESIRQEPGMFVYACLIRVIRLWSPLPHATASPESNARRSLRYLVATWYVVLYALIIVGLFRLRKNQYVTPWIWGLMFCIGLTLLHTFFWSNIRMRAPLIPFLSILSVFGAKELIALVRPFRRKGR